MLVRSGDQDTICALSTPAGVGGIAVIRVSGDQALKLTRKLCGFLPEAPESHKIYLGICRSIDAATNGVGNDGSPKTEALDQVLAAFFSNGKSFTGEETIEISCHGGPVVTASILKELIKAGIRPAKRGEFTYRAFMNGRMDLIQAEAVLGLIESQTRQGAKIALRQLQGHLSDDFQKIEDDHLWILAHLEASIDFSTEDIEVVTPKALIDRTTGLINHVEKLISSYSQGRIIREGLQIALIGRPNVGKSSLLNALLKEDRAIVTAQAGTTRDLIEGRVMFSGVPVTFVDTAGLRESESEVERIGIERSKTARDRSDFIFHVIDLSSESWLQDVSGSFADLSGLSNVFLIFNKTDLDKNGLRRRQCEAKISEIRTKNPGFGEVFWVSAVSRLGLKDLEERVSQLVGDLDSESSNVVTQARHLERLQKIQSCLHNAVRLMKENASPEFTAFELQESIRAIHELLGKEFNEQVIDRIFKEFCLGK
jgi:tRNA modification GTPase